MSDSAWLAVVNYVLKTTSNPGMPTVRFQLNILQDTTCSLKRLYWSQNDWVPRHDTLHEWPTKKHSSINKMLEDSYLQAYLSNYQLLTDPP